MSGFIPDKDWRYVNGFLLAPWASPQDIEYAETHKIKKGISASKQNWGADNKIKRGEGELDTGTTLPTEALTPKKPTLEEGQRAVRRMDSAGFSALAALEREYVGGPSPMLDEGDKFGPQAVRTGTTAARALWRKNERGIPRATARGQAEATMYNAAQGFLGLLSIPGVPLGGLFGHIGSWFGATAPAAARAVPERRAWGTLPTGVNARTWPSPSTTGVFPTAPSKPTTTTPATPTAGGKIEIERVLMRQVQSYLDVGTGYGRGRELWPTTMDPEMARNISFRLMVQSLKASGVKDLTRDEVAAHEADILMNVLGYSYDDISGAWIKDEWTTIGGYGTVKKKRTASRKSSWPTTSSYGRSGQEWNWRIRIT